ncbi:MAG: amino acid ABC transporter substrate-binding protein [bacterium]
MSLMGKRMILVSLAVGLLLGNLGQADELRIGATISQTGHFASEVGPFGDFLNTWARELNSQGGVFWAGRRVPVRLFIYDDRSDEATSRRLYEKMATMDRVHLMLGPYSSPLTFAASTAAEIHKVPFLAICANSPRIYQRGYQWIACLIDEAPRYTHRYWEMIKAEGLAKSVSFVVEDTLHPKGVSQGATVLAREAGLEVLSTHVAPRDTRDFTPILLKLKAEDPDILFVSANIAFATLFMGQAREHGLRPREFHVIHHGGAFHRALGWAAEGVTGQSYWSVGMGGPGSQRFLDLLSKSRISLEDYPWVPAYMMAIQVVEDVMARSKSLEPSELLKALKSSQTETIGGRVYFRQDGVGSINTYPSQIQEGSYQIIWPPGLATASHRYPSKHGAGN